MYLSSDRFATPRPYVQGIAVQDVGAANAVLVGDVLTWDVGVYHITAELMPYIKAWSNNTYTLDYVWEFSSFALTIAGVPYGTYGIFVSMQVYPGKWGLWYGLSLFTPSTNPLYVVLPPPPDDYWLPRGNLS